LLTTIEVAHDMGHEGSEKPSIASAPTLQCQGRVVVKDFVRNCTMCQRNKGEQLHPTRLTQPLDVPSSVWSDIAMDFVEGFPCVNGKTVVLMVVDWFFKYAHFLPLGHPYTHTPEAGSPTSNGNLICTEVDCGRNGLLVRPFPHLSLEGDSVGEEPNA
jgi:hypothetical protein